jgi:hypothetical protein
MNVILSRTADNTAALRFRSARIVLQTPPHKRASAGKKTCNFGKNSKRIASRQ